MTTSGARQRNCLTATNTTNKKRQPSLVNKPIHSNPSTTTIHKNKSSPVNNHPKSTLQMIARPTLTSMAKLKEKKTPTSSNNGPGSTLRLRSMLAKRNPLKMINHQQQAIAA
jgi:hypothetical protein